VPSNRKYPLKELESALKEYTRDTGRVITLEYTLISGVNDTDASADKLAAFAKRIKGKVNLIACNPSFGMGARPGQGRIGEFRKVLEKKGVTATIRRSKGDDIMAACGQLAARKRQEEGQGSRVRGQGEK
jgi:23S rRNA (adenine2503-C2)-methyltransferase